MENIFEIRYTIGIIVPVSYTHLDVYKRQLIGQVVIKSSGLTLIIAIAISLTIVTLIGAFFVGKMKRCV